MKKKQIRQLTEASYVYNKLDESRVNRIIEHLTASELREYLKALQKQERQVNVFVDSSFELSEQNKKSIEEIFPNKNLIFGLDPNLISGIRIRADDMLYNVNIKNLLAQIKDYIKESL